MTKGINILLFGLIIFSLVYLASHLLQEGQFSPTSDEGHYYSYAQQVSQHGPEVFGGLIDQYFSHLKDQFYPPPTRIAYVLTSAMLLKLYSGYWILGLFSFLCFILFLLVHFIYCRKYFGQDVALLSAVLLSASPLLLAMSRRALTESAVNLLLTMAVWLFLDYIVLRKKITYVFFLAVLCLSLMFKESSVVLVPFFILTGWLYPGIRRLGVLEFIGLACAGLLGGMIIPGLVIGWSHWLGTLDKLYQLQHAVFLINPYVIKYCEGPWYRYLLDLMLLSPLTLLLFVGYVFYYWTRTANDFNTKYLFIYFLTIYVLMLPLQKNIRYVINLDMVVAVFSVLMILELARRFVPASWRQWGVMAVVVLIFSLDYCSFIHIFVTSKVLDPVSAQLLSHQGFIPKIK